MAKETIERSRGETPLCVALLNMQLDMVKLLLSHGALVNIYTDDQRSTSRMCIWSRVLTPLEIACSGWLVAMKSDHQERLVQWRELIELLLPLCDDFSFGDTKQSDMDNDESDCESLDFDFEYGIPGNGFSSCIQMFCYEEIRCGAHDLEMTKLMLQHGATASFDRLHQWSFNYESDFLEAVTESFIKLAVLSGCRVAKFCLELPAFCDDSDKNFDDLGDESLQEEQQQLQEQRRQLLKTTLAVTTNPLSLQELSIMTIRSSFGGRRIWTKVDALPKGVPRHVKDMIKLKTW